MPPNNNTEFNDGIYVKVCPSLAVGYTDPLRTFSFCHISDFKVIIDSVVELKIED
jgi:hypothetical protein